MPDTLNPIHPADGAPIDEERYPDELVFAFVYAIGTQFDPILGALTNELKQFNYLVETVKLSDLFDRHITSLGVDIKLINDPYYDRVLSRMEAGNKLCDRAKMEDFVALAGVDEINRLRRQTQGDASPRPRTAYVISSLKRPEEVDLLRQVYGPGFYLIGVYAPEQKRLMYLQTQKSLDEEKARALIKKDQKEKDTYGQNTRDTYALADLFIPDNPNLYRDYLGRFIDLIFGNPFLTPTQDEQSMFLAYAASLRSGDLSRQVGAALTTVQGDLLAVGCNDVPKFGGGLYWPGPGDQRDHVRGSDSNEKRRDEIIRELQPLLSNDETVSIEKVKQAFESAAGEGNPWVETLLADGPACDRIARMLRNTTPLDIQSAKKLLNDTPLFSLTEFGRTVHAEMDALLTCSRTGRSPVGTSLYTTTFPCHNCTRHVVAAGVARVVYIEPYPKSLAFRLHYDSIDLEEKGWDRSAHGNCRTKVWFEPFLGVGPRRYFDLFSLRLSSGRKIERKEQRGSGDIIPWVRGDRRPRVPMEPRSYLDREEKSAEKIAALAQKNITI